MLDFGRGRKEKRFHGEQGGGTSGYGGGVASVEIGRGGWVGELHGVEAQLPVWSAWAEES